MKNIKCQICNASLRQLSLKERDNLSSLQKIFYKNYNIFECNSSKTLTLYSEQLAPHYYIFVDNIDFLTIRSTNNSYCTIFKIKENGVHEFIFYGNIPIKHFSYNEFETILNFG